MIAAVVFGFAWPDGLPPVVGAAPYDVLARQVPRLLVVALNAGQDRGARFFPFLGTLDGQRSFLHLRAPLPPETLASLHKQGEVRILVDGEFRADALRLRIHDGTTLRSCFDGELPFHAARPLDVLRRLQFEIASVLGWEGRPAPPPALCGEALAWYLIARDEMLGLEANLPGSGDPLRALRRCVELQPGARDVQELLVESGAWLLRQPAHHPALAAVLAPLAEHPGAAPDLLRRIAALLHACGHDAAAGAWARVAQAMPGDAEAVERAASLLFHHGRLDEARALLLHVRAAGCLSPAARAQLAAVADRCGDRGLRDEACEELLQAAVLPSPVARLLLTFLFEMDRAGDARRVAEQSLALDAANAGLWLEHGRACLLLDDVGAASASLRRAVALGLRDEARGEADRMLRLCEAPGLLRAIQQTEGELRAGRAPQAVRTARRMVRTARHSGEAWLLLGVVRHRLRQDWRAERALRQALALDPSLAEAHNRLGILLVGRGRADEGYRHLARAGELAPADPSPQLHLAQACVVLGRRDEGQQHLDRAARLGANPQTLAAVRQQFFAA